MDGGSGLPNGVGDDRNMPTYQVVFFVVGLIITAVMVGLVIWDQVVNGPNPVKPASSLPILAMTIPTGNLPEVKWGKLFLICLGGAFTCILFMLVASFAG